MTRTINIFSLIYMYKYVDAGTRAAERSDLTKFGVAFETQVEVPLSPRCFVDPPHPARLFRPCRGRRRSCSVSVFVASTNVFLFSTFRVWKCQLRSRYHESTKCPSWPKWRLKQKQQCCGSVTIIGRLLLVASSSLAMSSNFAGFFFKNFCPCRFRSDDFFFFCLATFCYFCLFMFGLLYSFSPYMYREHILDPDACYDTGGSFRPKICSWMTRLVNHKSHWIGHFFFMILVVYLGHGVVL